MKIIENYLGKNLISPTQTHSANVDIAIKNKFEYPDTDGLILTKNNLAIFLNFADCTPLIFYDEKQNIGAISHAGWRGTAQKIAQITAEKLINEFDSKPQDICVLIGPAICGKCYEVGEEVYNNFSPSPLPPTCCDNEYFYSYRKENGTTFRHSAILKLK